MARHILICPQCRLYTMKAECPSCAERTVAPKPPKYSPDDRYAEMKRDIKRDEYRERGLIQ